MRCTFAIFSLLSTHMNNRFADFLASAESVQQGITEFKTEVVKQLNISLHREAERTLIEKKEDEELFSRFLTQPIPAPPSAQSLLDDNSTSVKGTGGSLKRGVSEVVQADAELAVIPKVSF